MTPDAALQLLRTDPLRHIVSLKMLTRFGPQMTLRFAGEAQAWALLSLLPSQCFEYDARTYPTSRFIALIDGTSEALQLELLDQLPSEELVVKTYTSSLRHYLVSQRAGTRVATFASFSAPPSLALPRSSVSYESFELSTEASQLFERAGYGLEELERSFRDGSRWFGIEREGALVGGCFVFRNFDAVWEIAGVFTDPRFRRQGLAATVVRAATAYLLSAGCVPRYQVTVANLASMQVAHAVGLREFIRVDHVLIPRH